MRDSPEDAVPVSKKLRRQIVSSIRAEIFGVSQRAMPDCHNTSPDQWTKEDAERADMLADVERKTIASGEKLLAE